MFSFVAEELYKICIMVVRRRTELNVSRWITLVAITLIILMIVIIVISSYQKQYQVFSGKFESSFIESIRESNVICPQLGKELVSAKDKSTIIITRGGIINSCKVDTMIDIESNVVQALYDIRDPQRWNLKRLAGILQQKFEYERMPFTLVLTDSTGKRLDYYGVVNGENLLDDSYSVPMGFLDGHRLTVYYTFPWKYFFILEWRYMIMVWGGIFLLGSCIFMLFRIIRQNKKRMENLELFVQALNHDLKSPINDLKMKLYLIQKESVAPFSPQQQELYTLAQTKTGKLLDSIDKLLQDSIDYKGLHVEMKELEISTFIQQLTEDWQRSVTGEKEIKLQVSMQMENTLIRADAYHLSRAIWNLLENAWKYSDDRVQIDITCRRIGRYVEISVKDNGRGIDKSELKNVFKRNYRIVKGENRKVKGYGLGLSYVMMIARAHGGRVWVESDWGTGCNFVIRIKA